MYTAVLKPYWHCRGQQADSPEPEFESAAESSDSEYISSHSSAGAFDALRSGSARQQDGRANSAVPPAKGAKANAAKGVAAKARSAAL